MRGQARVSGLVLFVAGLALLLAYWLWELSLPRGIAEFSYWPPLEPLPFAAMRGFTFEQLAGHAGRLVLLGPALVLLGLALAARGKSAPRSRASHFSPDPGAKSEKYREYFEIWQRRAGGKGPLSSWSDFCHGLLARARPLDEPRGVTLNSMAVWASVLCLALSAWVMLGVLRGRAIVDDELTYEMQALLLAEGKLGETTVPPWGDEPFTIWTPRGATGKYLFGEPLVQVLGSLVGIPGLAHLGLAALCLFLWHRLVRRSSDPRVAAWATLLLAVSPMFILTTATGMSHATSMASVVAAGWGVGEARGGRPWLGALVVGTALGFGVTVRPQVVVPAGLVLGGVTLWHLLRRRRFGAAALLVAVGLLWAGLIAAYNQALTGSPLELPWELAEPRENYGFGPVSEGSAYVHTPLRALQNLLVTAVRFNAWWLGWPLSLGLLVVWGLVGRPRKGAGLWLAVGGAIVLFHVPYYSVGVSDTGPVYYYELLLPASLLGAHALAAAIRRRASPVMALLVLHLGLGTGTFLYKHTARLDRLVTAIHTPAEFVLDEVEPPALLIVETASREALHSGWVFSFPARLRRDVEPIVVYPRGDPEGVAPLRARYPERACYYYRVHPETLEHQVLPCSDAEHLLARPGRLPGRPLWLRFPPTAVRLGLVDPFAN